MKTYNFDKLGEIQKGYEKIYSSSFMPGLPIIARLDGRAFHSFTKGMERPFDLKFSSCMVDTAEKLISETNCDIAYTQSDEITLVWINALNPENECRVFFAGKIQKMNSILASTATLHFNKLITKRMPDLADRNPMFDCRVWQVPTLELAAENLLWRELDASRNSLNMVASYYYSPSELLGKSNGERHEMLHNKGVNWNDFPIFFKRGTYLKKVATKVKMSEAELNAIPEAHRPPEGVVTRNVINVLVLPKASSVDDLVGIYFS